MIITYLQDMRNVYTILLFSMLIFSAQGCLQDLDDIFFNATAGTVAQFDYGLVDTTGTVTYEVKKSGQIAKLRLAYIAGVPGSPQLNTGVTFTGDAATGHISFDYSGAVDGDKGTYALTDTSGTELKCQTLYSLGETTVEVDQVGTANIGGSATFQCTAESATLPVRSGIVFEYRWTFGLEINPSGMKFDYDGNSFTIKDITEADKSKGCSCSAKEEVGIALFSSESKTKYIEAIGTTTTSTTTTTITSHTTSMTTSSIIAATTSSIPTSATSISTSTTSTMAQSTVTSAPSTSRGTVPTTGRMTMPVTSEADSGSDKALVTMIIVVSVIGGVLIVAIFSVMFVMMHRKSCFTRKGHSTQIAKRSDHRKQHRRAKHNANGRFLTTGQYLAVEGYHFYNGRNKNPLFCDQFENLSYVNNYNQNQKNSRDLKNVSSQEAYQYNYNWDI